MTFLNSANLLYYLCIYILVYILLYPILFIFLCGYFILYTYFYVLRDMLFALKKGWLSNFVVHVTMTIKAFWILNIATVFFLFFFIIIVDTINGGRMAGNSPGLRKEMAVSTLPWGNWWKAYSHTVSKKEWQSIPQLQRQVLCANDGCSRCKQQVHLCKCGYPR